MGLQNHSQFGGPSIAVRTSITNNKVVRTKQMLLTNNDVYKRDRQTCNFKAISTTDGCTYVSEGLGTIGHVVGSGHNYINSQYILVPTRSITS